MFGILLTSIKSMPPTCIMRVFTDNNLCHFDFVFFFAPRYIKWYRSTTGNCFSLRHFGDLCVSESGILRNVYILGTSVPLFIVWILDWMIFQRKRILLFSSISCFTRIPPGWTHFGRSPSSIVTQCFPDRYPWLAKLWLNACHIMGVICNHIMGVVVLFFKSFNHQAFRIDSCVIPTVCAKHIVATPGGSG